MPKIYQLGKKRKPSMNLPDILEKMSKQEMKDKIIQQSQEIQTLKNINRTQSNKINTQSNKINSLTIQLATANSNNLRQKMKIKKNNLAKKETKILKAMNETHEEILDLYEEEQKQKDPGIKAFSKRWKNLNKKKKNFNTLGSRLIKIIDKLDEKQPKKKNEILDKKKFSFPFGVDIDENQLTGFLEKIVDFINENYSVKVRRALKGYFKDSKIETNIRLIDNKKEIVSTLKTDMIISLLLEKDKEELSSLSAPILCNKISEIPLNEITIREKKDNIIFNKNFLKKAVKTKIIRDIYDKVCNKYVSNYSNYYIDITQTLVNHIDRMKIYFGELPEDICGLTLYSGDVIINAKYLNWIYSNNKNSNLSKKQAVCSIFLTLLREFSHILVRLVKSMINNRNKNININQFEESEDLIPGSAPNSILKGYNIKGTTNIFAGKKNQIVDEFNKLIDKYNKISGKKTFKKNTKKGMNEHGDFFDYNLFGIKSYFELTQKESDYFLNLKNFENTNIQDYYKKLKNVYNLRKSNSRAFPFKSTNFQPYAISFGKCNFSKRNN